MKRLWSDTVHDPAHYKKIGFKCGLEIHQRLATEEKLFCSCSARPSSAAPYAKIERRQRAVAGELGAMDRSTSFESSRGRSFVYNIFKGNSCLVDIDEEPPHSVNGSAVEIALKVAAALDCSVPDEIEPMRKEVVDGSDPSAFQRSMIVGYAGSIELQGKKIPICSLFLEEESSGIEGTKSSAAVYNVDRLGIPLLEIDTDPVIETPEEAKEVAMRLGLLLRLTGNAQRGIGSIRQDVNVSIREGTRVEIKGLQEIYMVDEVIEHEVERQLKLVEIKNELVKRNTEIGKTHDLTVLLKHCKAKIISDALSAGGIVLAVPLKNFKGMLGYEINPDRRLGTEVSDYAKMAGVRGIIHSDESLKKYGFEDGEIAEIYKTLKIDEKKDAFVMVAAPKEICEKAVSFARQRIEMAAVGVPPETRGANSNNPTTKFLRPLPGGSRMYPETDAVPIAVDQRYYEELMKDRIDVEEIRKRLEKQIGNKQLSDQMLWSPELQLYDKVVERSKVDPQFVATILLEKLKEMRRNGIKVDEIEDAAMVYAFEKYMDKTITKVGVEEVLKLIPKSSRDVDTSIESKKLKRLSHAGIKKLVAEAGTKVKTEIIRKVMSENRATVDGEDLKKVIEESK